MSQRIYFEVHGYLPLVQTQRRISALANRANKKEHPKMLLQVTAVWLDLLNRDFSLHAKGEVRSAVERILAGLDVRE
jgi:hypothetical protein